VWDVTPERAIETKSSIVVLGRRGKQPVVVKVVANGHDEWVQDRYWIRSAELASFGCLIMLPGRCSSSNCGQDTRSPVCAWIWVTKKQPGS